MNRTLPRRGADPSSGAALATMDALMLSQNLDPSVQVTATVYGLPRGGNQAFADMIDSSVSGFPSSTVQHQREQLQKACGRVISARHNDCLALENIPSGGAGTVTTAPYAYGDSVMACSG